MLISHLDFKGALPRISHLPQLLQDTAALGFDAVLVEYEDVFPFANDEFSAAPDERWSPQTLQSFLDEAARLNLEVIPLQQGLAHLEWVFRWEKFHKWTLDKDYPSTVDFNNAEARNFIFGLLDEVLEAHPQSRYVHVGMDEAHGMVGWARDNGADVVTLFLDHLDEICARCEAHGKTPIIWSDMIEDNFNPAALSRFSTFKDRVILCSWDYSADGTRHVAARIDGQRTTRAWLDEPQNAGASPLGPGTKWIEDLDENAREIIAPFYDGRTFAPLFWCDIWVQMGFQVIGASASRASEDFAVMPHFHKRRANIETWQSKIEETSALGHVVTSWARGTTFCPPIFPFDLTWPLLEDAARSAEKNPPPFFKGIDRETVSRLVLTLGRCRESWSIETQIADEMDALESQVLAHVWEWKCLSLMARVLSWQKRAAAVQDEVDYFKGGVRLPAPEWQRRLNDQAEIMRSGTALRADVASHFGERYAGDAFEEWLRDVFDAPMSRLQNCAAICRNNMEIARERYAL